MINAVRVNLTSDNVRGVDASVLYGLPEEQRNYVLELLNQGFDMTDALRVMANSRAMRVERLSERGDRANPFPSS